MSVLKSMAFRYYHADVGVHGAVPLSWLKTTHYKALCSSARCSRVVLISRNSTFIPLAPPDEHTHPLSTCTNDPGCRTLSSRSNQLHLSYTAASPPGFSFLSLSFFSLLPNTSFYPGQRMLHISVQQGGLIEQGSLLITLHLPSTV